MTENTALTLKYLELCQTQANQGLAFNFSLTFGTSFFFILDTRKKEPALEARKKKTSPSSLRRNKIRRQKFLETRKISKASVKQKSTPKKTIHV